MMAYERSPSGKNLSFWNSSPIGKSINLHFNPYEHISPQLILEYKVLHSALHSQIQFLGTLISDDETQSLTYVIDRLNDSNNHQRLTGEFLIPIQYQNKNPSIINNLIQNGIKDIATYCHSSLPIELHRFCYICSQISSPSSSSSVNRLISFNLITIKTSFKLTPISILPTALLNTLNLSSKNQFHFGYCCLDRQSKNKILFILENDSQIFSLPLIGIWISGINDIRSTYVWAACIRYYMNSSLKHRLRSGKTSQQAFLLVYHSSTSNQCSFYEVCLLTNNSSSTFSIEYDLWTCSKQISSLSTYDENDSTQFPYDFQFKRVFIQPNTFVPIQSARFTKEISSNDNHQTILTSPNTNGSLFGIPRLPPKQSIRESPSWDSLSTTPVTSPKRTTVPTDNRWKEEIVERMHSYENHIQSLTALVTQLLQQNSISSPIKESTKHDVSIQSESLNHQIEKSSSPKFEHREQQTSFIDTSNMSSLTQSKSPSIVYQQEPIMKYSSPRKSTPSLPLSTDLNPVDILKPIFRFIDHQQQKQQQGSIPSKETEHQTENMFHLTHTLTPQQQQHLTSTRTTGISFISNGVQMQFINQQSSTTTLYPQSQSLLLPTSPQKSENNLSIEVHSLEMKYLEDDQLAAAIECDPQKQKSVKTTPQTTQNVDKSLSFGTEEYLRRYGLFTKNKHDENDL